MPLPARTIEGSDELLAGLFDRHQERLYRLALRMTGDAEAARIAQLLGLRPATVRWHLSIGRKELARLLLARTRE